MTQIQPMTKTIKVTASWKPPLVIEGDADGLPISMDQPERLGGTDTAPGPLQFVVSALVGCAGQTLALIARQTGFSYTAARFEAEGDIDLRGFMGEVGVCRHFCDFRGKFVVKTEESQERFEEIVALVEDRCPVYNLLHDAGVQTNIAWKRE